MCFYPIRGLSRKAKPGMKMPYNYFSKTNSLCPGALVWWCAWLLHPGALVAAAGILV
jgi:hypothetical protein